MLTTFSMFCGTTISVNNAGQLVPPVTYLQITNLPATFQLLAGNGCTLTLLSNTITSDNVTNYFYSMDVNGGRSIVLNNLWYGSLALAPNASTISYGDPLGSTLSSGINAPQFGTVERYVNKSFVLENISFTFSPLSSIGAGTNLIFNIWTNTPGGTVSAACHISAFTGLLNAGSGGYEPYVTNILVNITIPSNTVWDVTWSNNTVNAIGPIYMSAIGTGYF